MAQESALIVQDRPRLNPSTKGLAFKVFKGSFWTLVGQIVPLLVSFLATPFVIRLLGADGYGVLLLVVLIPGYCNFADLGMGIASTKFGSEAYAVGDTIKEAKLIRTAALISLVTSAPIGIAIFVFSDSIAGAFNIPIHLHANAVLALRLSSATFVINFLNSIFNTPQLTRLRMDLNSIVTAGFRIVGIVVTPVLLHFGAGIVGAVTVLMLVSILTLGGHLYVSWRLLPPLFGMQIDKGSIRPLIKFGGALALSGIAAVFLVNAEKLVLTKVTNVQTLAYYSVAFTFANMASMFGLAMGQSLLPAFTQLLGPEKRLELNSLFSRTVRINVFGLLPVLTVLCVVGRPFFNSWAGKDFGQESTWPFYVLLIGLFFNLNAYNSAGLLFAAGRTDIVAKLYWIQLFPYIALTAILTAWLGAVGAAIAWSSRVTLEVFVYMWLARKYVGVRPNLTEQIPSFLIGLSILLPSICIAIYWQEFSYWSIIVLTICIAFYLIVIWKKQLQNDEKAWLASKAHQITDHFRSSN